jgi:hypothetical protein
MIMPMSSNPTSEITEQLYILVLRFYTLTKPTFDAREPKLQLSKNTNPQQVDDED